MKQYTDKELLNMLYDEWIKRGKIRCEDFKARNGLPHYSIFTKRFGSWENAKELANVKQVNRKKKCPSKQEVIEEFKNVCNKLGYVPTLSDFVSNSNIVNKDFVRKLFCSYESLIFESDEESSKCSSKYKEEFLISEIKRFVDEYGRVPKQVDFDGLKGYPSRKTFSNHFGNFKSALVAAGYDYIYKNQFYDMTKNERMNCVINEITKLYEQLKHIPTLQELEYSTSGLITRTSIRKDFGSYSSALESAKLVNPNNKINGRYTDEFLKREFNRFVMENGRIPQLHEFNANGYPSFYCYQSRFGSWNNAVKFYGYEPTYTIRRYELPNGELCDSLYELNISTWLQENNVEYERNIPYSKICNRYNGKMNCDYKFNINGKCVYVEMAGFLPRKDIEWSKFSDEEKNYARKLRYKKKIMDMENVLYYIIYPQEIKNRDIGSIYENIQNLVAKIKS